VETQYIARLKLVVKNELFGHFIVIIKKIAIKKIKATSHDASFNKKNNVYFLSFTHYKQEFLEHESQNYAFYGLFFYPNKNSF